MDIDAALGHVERILTALGVLGAISVSLRNGRTARRAVVVGEGNAVKIQDVHLSINSRMDEFLAAQRLAGRIDERTDVAAAQRVAAGSAKRLKAAQEGNRAP